MPSIDPMPINDLLLGSVRMRYRGRDVRIAERNTIHLQSYGRSPAIRADQIQIGNVLLWNFGIDSEVVKIEEASKHYLNVTERYRDRTGGMTETVRRMKKNRMVGLSSAKEHWDANPQLADLILAPAAPAQSHAQ